LLFVANTNFILKIPFNIPYVSGNEVSYINQVIKEENYSSGGKFNKLCEEELEKITGCNDVRMTNSCTSSLEIAAIAINLQPGDEVILPSFTFVSTANAFALRGAKLVFVDINPTTMCLDEELLEKAVSNKTKAVVLVHYTGFTSNFKKVKTFCEKHNLYLIEDAAQSIDSYSNNKHLGTYGDMAGFSFHDTKNIQCGEGGALLVNNKSLLEKVDIILQNGTNRKDFLLGHESTYTWKGLGSSFGLSEVNAAILYAQLKELKKVTKRRVEIYSQYSEALLPLKEKGKIDFPVQKEGHNAHIFFIKARSKEERNSLIDYLKSKGIAAYFHYLPLHLSSMGNQYSYINSEFDFTLQESEKLVRLPLFYSLSDNEVSEVVSYVNQFYHT